jgi:RNase H-like domain found in reverse transcriptase
MMVGAEHRYSPIEKYCLALIFAVKKLRHYMLAHKIILISKVDPLKYLMTQPILTGRLAKWAIILTEFDIEPTEPEIHITVRNRRSLSLCQITNDAGNENAESREAKQQEAMMTEEDDDWRQPFIEYFQHGTLPKDKRAADQLRKRVLRYAYVGNTLYRRSYDQLWLRCVSGPEAEQVMREIHSGLCGAHQSGPKMK